VLQVSSDEASFLAGQIGNAAGVRLVVDARRGPAQAFNITARIRGRQPGLPPVIVTAPRSTWWRGTSERGGALVCLLEVVRALSSTRPARDCVFLAASGTELGHLGLDAYRKAHADVGASVWISLGPSLAASQFDGLWLRTSVPAFESVATSLLREADVGEPGGAPDESAALEHERLAAAGLPYIAFGGRGNPVVHTQADRWPEAVAMDRILKLAEASVRLGQELTKA
jgi:hypothetical protein